MNISSSSRKGNERYWRYVRLCCSTKEETLSDRRNVVKVFFVIYLDFLQTMDAGLVSNDKANPNEGNSLGTKAF